MDEVGISVVAKLAEYLVGPTLRQLQYLFCVGKITRNVETKKEELILKQGRAQERVEEAIKRTERIDDEVKKWKNEVVLLIAEVENLVQELRANNGCFQRWRPTWRRYRLCKVLAKKVQHMTELNTKSDQLEPFSHHVIVPDIEYHSSKDFVFFKSTKISHDELLEALQDDDNSLIGLWGMGGSGKTTLVKEVGKKAKESGLFDRVIITTVSQTPNIRKIQGEIADFLGLELKEESEVGRARRIAMKLQSPEEQILIILDDVWATLNLEDIGNPFGVEGPRNNKVLLTSRRREICTLMECQKTIPLGLLTEDEAWDLFQTLAKVDDSARKVAQEVAMECKGLPIAIVAMGKCLKGKGLDEAIVVLDKLRRSKPVDVDKGGSDAFTCLKLSYDYLRIVEAKLLFLMCAMFPEDHEIIIEDLFRYGVGFGLCEDADSFEIARSQIISAINVLIDSSLLMYSLNIRNEKCVKMHDMVRDVALWIASEEHGTILVDCAKDLNEFLRDEMTKDCYAISSWNKTNESLQFPSQLDAPKLELLLLNSIEPLDLSHASFEGVKGLKVVALIDYRSFYPTLYLTKVALQSLQSIQRLSNLRTLCLQGWDLGDISFVVSLKRLEILDLKYSKFKKLPNGMEKLYRLKLLDLSRCEGEECFCREIGRCSQLQELYSYRNSRPRPSEYTICYESSVGVSALPKLKRYTCEIGKCIGTMVWKKVSRELSFGELNISISSAMIKDLAQRAIAIQFYKLQGGWKRFSPDVIQAVGGMNELTKLCLQRCSEIECFIDQTIPHEDIVVFRLVELVLKYMDNLKQLCRGPPNLNLFLNLESLNIESCPQLVNMFPANCNLGNLKFLNIVNCPLLTSLFPVSVSRTLLLLEQLKIKGCHGLKHIIEGEDGVDIWEDMIFPKWEILFVCDCYRLEFICPIFCVQGFVQLKSLVIRDAPQLKFVFGEHAGEETSICDRIETKIVLPVLEKLRLENLPNLLSICSGSYHLLWPSIMKVEWIDCPRLNTSCDSHIIDLELSQSRLNMESHVFDDHQLRSKLLPAISNVESILLFNCGVVSTFIRQIPIFQYLKQLSVEECAKLKFVFSACIFQSLPELTSITVSRCEEMEQVFLGNEETQKNLPMAQFCLPSLQSLEIKQCNKLKSIFSSGVVSTFIPQIPIFQSLKQLYVAECAKLKFVFSACIFQSLPKLTSITISRCEEMEQVFLGNEETQKNLPMAQFCLPSLQSLEIKQCNNLKSIFSSGVVPTFIPQIPIFQSLKQLYVAECAKLKFVFSACIFQSLPELTSITISSCEEMEQVFLVNEETQKNLPMAQFCLPNLQSLKIKQCNKLKSIFSFMISDAIFMLPELRTPSISGASQLEEIFRCTTIEDHDIESEKKIMFPNLGSIILERLPRLANFCQGFKFQIPKYCSVFIYKCPKLVPNVGSSAEGIRVKLVWKLVRKHVLKCSQLGNNEGYSPPLLSLNSEELDDLSVEVQDSCRVIGDKDSEIFSIHQILKGLTPTQGLSFQFLLCLQVVRCEKLKFLFSASTIVHNSLPKLKFLTLSDCEELEEIIACNEELPNASNAQVCFPKLEELKIQRCNKLRRLFSTTINTILPQLYSLLITEASQLEVIFGHKREDGANNGEKIVLPKLSQIKLRNLPNFVNVCQGFQFETVQLRSINICKCPKLLNPILGSTQMVSLQQWKSMDSRGVEDFQSEASAEEQFHVSEEKGTIMVSKVKSLALRHSANLMTTLWEGPTLISFQNLLVLKVFECRKLKSIFPCTVIKSLPRLSCLSIKECEELEEIISEKWEQEEHDHFPNSSLCFPQLSRLEVYRCSKLKYLFSLPFNGDLAKLKDVRIKGCSQLEQVFSCALEIREEESNKNLLPNLKSLLLQDMPKLTHICASVPFLVKFLSRRILKVKHCPVFAKTDNVEESEDYDLDGFYDDDEFSNDDDSIEFETTHQFLQLRAPQLRRYTQPQWMYREE